MIQWKPIPTDLRALDHFMAEVNSMAEANMLKTGKLEGSHYAAMQKVREDWERRCAK